MKVPTYCRENDGLLQELLLTFQRYAELSGSVTMRAFSSQCFHDTKYFERNVRELFLTIARKYNTQLAAACTEAELGERDQLAFLGIFVLSVEAAATYLHRLLPVATGWLPRGR